MSSSGKPYLEPDEKHENGPGGSLQGLALAGGSEVTETAIVFREPHNSQSVSATSWEFIYS